MTTKESNNKQTVITPIGVQEIDVTTHRPYDPKQIYGQSQVDWEIRIDMESLRKKRLDRARAAMKNNGLGAFLFFQHYNIRYITGTYGGMWQTFDKLFRYVLLIGDADPIMFEVPGVDYICQRQGAPWIKDWRPAIIWRAEFNNKYEIAKKFAAEIKALLDQNGAGGAKVGIDLLDAAGYEALNEAGIKVVDGTRAMQEAVMIKMPEELEILKQACAIQDSCYYVVNEMLRPGIKENDLKAAIVAEAYRLGAERFEQITMATGGRTNPFWRSGSTDKILRYGDMVLIDICLQYNGYNTCYYRNFVVGGDPTPLQKHMHKECYDLVYGAINLIKPGNTTADVAKFWRDCGYGDDGWGSVSLLQFGHGLGTTNHEPPFIDMANAINHPVTFQKGMYMAIENYVGKPGLSEAARLEENLVINDDGAVIFSLYPFPAYFKE
jgi:Xaa-Pro dipeptidase